MIEERREKKTQRGEMIEEIVKVDRKEGVEVIIEEKE